MSVVSQFQKLSHDRLIEMIGETDYKEASNVLDESEKAYDKIREEAKKLGEMDNKELGMLLI